MPNSPRHRLDRIAFASRFGGGAIVGAGIALGVGGFGATSSVPGLVAIAIGAVLVGGLLSAKLGRRFWDILLRWL